uniref:SSD domain-containing protein n=1 Tax=Meloidogyne hapla TaxID=6305 RepID=A0A1I8B712_MELHA
MVLLKPCFSLEPLLCRFFYFFGTFVHRYRWPMVIIPPLLSACLSVGFIWVGDLRVDDPGTPGYIKLFLNCWHFFFRWKRELGTFSKLWPLDENRFIAGKSFETKRFVNILCKAKDGKRDLCLGYDWKCSANEHIEMFRQMTQVGRVIELTYPKGGNKDTPAYLGTAIGDIKLNKTDGTVQAAKIIQMFFFLKQEPANVRKYSTDFEYAVERFLLHGFESPLIDISFAHYQSIEDGLDDNARRFFPNFVTSVFALTIFCIACAFTFRVHNENKRKISIDWIRSKPLVACAGLLTTLFALLSSFGLLLLFGIPYNVINTIIPFLIIAVGVDDMFVLNACWSANSAKTLTVSERTAQMMRDGGVAVSITNITDILAFLVGCVTELPGIELFCIYAFLSVLFCYIYQLTFFTGFMAIMGEAENQQRHCILLYKIKDYNENLNGNLNCKQKIEKIGEINTSVALCNGEKISNIKNGKININSTNPCFIQNIRIEPTRQQLNKTTIKALQQNNLKNFDNFSTLFSSSISSSTSTSSNFSHHFFTKYFAPFILNNAIRLLILLIFISYICLAIIGCLNFREGLEPSHLVTSDHYVGKYFEDMKIFWKMGAQLHVAGTVFFFLEFLNYLEQLNAEAENTERIWNQKLRSWLKFTGASNQWESDIVFNRSNNEINAFRFQIALKNIVEANQHKLSTKLLREIADSQPFNLEIYHEMFPFADQYLIILPSTLRNVFISLLCMTAVALLLIPSLPSAMLIILSIISIATGVFGYMTFWGVNLDAVSMISIIMSIGFAVDLSAHIVYAFVSAQGKESKERVVCALGHIGWPIFQVNNGVRNDSWINIYPCFAEHFAYWFLPNPTTNIPNKFRN